MNTMKIIGLCLLFFLPIMLSAQTNSASIKGFVKEKLESNQEAYLVGANVYWLGSTIGTTTDVEGAFELKRIPSTTKLVVSFIAYSNDTIETSNTDFFDIILSSNNALDEVEVVHRSKSTEISRINPIKVEQIGEKELLKAACCNLSESFETSPSVDVSFTDAVTGTRQIQMLGLAGPYTQITRENIPDVRGLASIYGLTFTPGTWVSGIQLNKGAGSVVNGYESIAGQINVELKKPETAERLYLNAYMNEGRRLEANANFAHRFKNDKWSTALLLHAKDNSKKNDRNADGFLDNPLGVNLIGLNRWKYVGDNGIRLQFGIKGTYIDMTGGQVAFDPKRPEEMTGIWGMDMDIKRLDAWAKIGKVYEDAPWKSMGLQMSGILHQQRSDFGLNTYDADQNSLYLNYIYQSILSSTQHQFKTGFSFQYDNYDEDVNTVHYDRKTYVPGAYFEYTYIPNDLFSIVGGLRADYHNLYGLFFTPRVHMRWEFAKGTVWRASAGRGQRTADIFAEHNSMFASSRTIFIQQEDEDLPYGLDPEIAWNYGTNLTHCFQFGQREGAVTFDYYRTDFKNQVVMDLDQSARAVYFYNLKGKSYSNSFQAQLDYELFERFDMRIAYRWFDVKTDYEKGLLEKPLIAKHRAFMNLAYATKNDWRFDWTINWQGQKRLPFTGDNPVEYQLDDYSPSFVTMNAQISKTWKDKFEIYVGGENLLNYKQAHPIIASQDPFGAYFDSSLIWGPIFGRNIYAGLRYRLN